MSRHFFSSAEDIAFFREYTGLPDDTKEQLRQMAKILGAKKRYMTSVTSLHPLREANEITQMLDKVFGQDHFNRRPVDIATLALEYSRQVTPKSPIHLVEERDLKGCMGALVYSEEKPRQWGIAYHQGQSPGRRSFTIGHEFRHYVLHRDLIETDLVLREACIATRQAYYAARERVCEKEADTFRRSLTDASS